MFELAEYNRNIAALESKAGQAAERAKIGFSIKSDDLEKFRIVFVGQYSAGKSSILSALTGRTDIRIGAGITTDEVQVYDWSGIEVVDTPGIHTEKRPEHDERSYDAIASADMLVYVVTDELFDSNIAEHFRKLAIEHDKGGEMILVVNKMMREKLGNTPEQQKIKRDALADVVKPYTPEDLGLCFMDAESYLKSIKVREKNPGLADKLLARSGYKNFVDTLNRFVREKNLSLKLTTRLYEIDDFLQKAIKQLEPGTGDKDIDALEERFLQQRHVFSERMQRLEQQIRNIYTKAVSDIIKIGNDAATCLKEGCKQEAVEEKLNKAVEKANSIIEKCQNAGENKLIDGLKELDVEMGNIEKSEFSVALTNSINVRWDSLPESVKNILNKTVKWSQDIGKTIVKNGRIPSSSGGWSLPNFSGSNLHSFIKSAGHLVGYKFKPWEAAKWTRFGTGAGMALSAFGIGLSVFMQIKSEQEEEKLLEELKKGRQDIRSEFERWGDGLECCGRAFVSENVTKLLGSQIQKIDHNIDSIRESRENKNASCTEMEQLHTECQSLIKKIHKQPVSVDES